jgi:hypothetical protein
MNVSLFYVVVIIFMGYTRNRRGGRCDDDFEFEIILKIKISLLLMVKFNKR